jgi:hypothetical protein
MLITFSCLFSFNCILKQGYEHVYAWPLFPAYFGLTHYAFTGVFSSVRLSMFRIRVIDVRKSKEWTLSKISFRHLYAYAQLTTFSPK